MFNNRWLSESYLFVTLGTVDYGWSIGQVEVHMVKAENSLTLLAAFIMGLMSHLQMWNPVKKILTTYK